ncbi:hypothetical protein FF38_13678 [Lucilia cuprina]|uniref:Uncharacterized protein n=1 Tax=Lucilia cuprina TaxID=7375 RepID=A0A0L0CNV7_LUCCU|nr:hypothetical protein FF38_13678 [Lucilia cuprina]
MSEMSTSRTKNFVYVNICYIFDLKAKRDRGHAFSNDFIIQTFELEEKGLRYNYRNMFIYIIYRGPEISLRFNVNDEDVKVGDDDDDDVKKNDCLLILAGVANEQDVIVGGSVEAFKTICCCGGMNNTRAQSKTVKIESKRRATVSNYEKFLRCNLHA